jgi:hypothetical protein
VESRTNIARILVTIPAFFLAIVPPLVDLSESHVLNPLWIGHARLHTVWLLATNSLVSLIALGVVWRPSALSTRHAVLFGAALVGAVLSGFFVAAATQSAYDGSLTDPNGVAAKVGPLDANLAMFSLLLCLLIVAVAMVRKPAT